jgi:hypothetical protein
LAEVELGSTRMDALRGLLADLKRHGMEPGMTLGLLNVLIGRKIEKADGTPVSAGLTWRSLAAVLKKSRWPKEAVTDLGLEPRALPPRDRVQYWYTAISLGGVDSPKATEAGNALTLLLEQLGYRVSR